MSEEITALSIAGGLEKIYEEFTDGVKAIGGKHGRGKMSTSVLHWITGGHVKTQRDVLCDKFLLDVKAQLQNFDYAVEGLDEKDAREAYDRIADIMSGPWPADSNSTTDLMKRAMISQLKPYIPRISREKLVQVKERLEKGYSRSRRFPVEKDIIKEIEKTLQPAIMQK